MTPEPPDDSDIGDTDDVDAIVEATISQGRDLILTREVIVNGIRIDPGVYRVRIERVGPAPIPPMDDHPF